MNRYIELIYLVSTSILASRMKQSQVQIKTNIENSTALDEEKLREYKEIE